MQYLG